MSAKTIYETFNDYLDTFSEALMECNRYLYISSHYTPVVIEEVNKETGEEKNILFNLCGHGYLDLSAYDSYFAGNMVDYSLSSDEIDKAMESVPKV